MRVPIAAFVAVLLGQKMSDYFGLKPGDRLGSEYEVTGFLGSGWEGEVYKVVERATGVLRAAKLFYPQRNVAGRAILRYARKVDKLKHIPAIIQYHHRGSARVDGASVEFVVSEYAPGKLLSQIIEDRDGDPFPSFEALHIIRAVAQAVAPIHRAGEYHGDLHPLNVMVRREGLWFRIKLLDFFDLGKATKAKIADDVVDIMKILYELVGGSVHYRYAGSEIKRFVQGRRWTLVKKQLRNADDLLAALDTFSWGM